MRILSWNVNGLRAITNKGFASWLNTDAPDIICLQETKARPDQLKKEILELPLPNGDGLWHQYYASAKRPGYSGVAIFSKEKPLDVQPLGIADFDDEGRVLIAYYPSFTLISAYFPNSQEAGARLDYKLAFCEAIKDFSDKIIKEGGNLILAGDYNIAHRPIDLARPKENEGNPGYLPEEREWMGYFLDSGYIDTFREFYPEKTEAYSWWSYRQRARERNVGWRLDYHCISPSLLPRLKSAAIMAEVLGSDHCPVEITLE